MESRPGPEGGRQHRPGPESDRVTSPSQPGPAGAFLRDMEARGRLAFSTEEAARALGAPLAATRWILRRLKISGRLAVPYRGFYVVVPPEHQESGAPPAELFVPQLMEHLEVPYYAALLTAADYHCARASGAAEGPPRFQVMVPKNRQRLRCGPVRVEFVARHNAAEMPVDEVETARGPLAISTLEATAFDLVGYARHCGGLDAVADVLDELAPGLDPERLREVAPLCPLPWSQRLGFLLDRLGHRDRTTLLADWVSGLVMEWAPLSPRRQRDEARWDGRWKLSVNRPL